MQIWRHITYAYGTLLGSPSLSQGVPTHFRDLLLHNGTVYGEMLAPTLEDTFVVNLTLNLLTTTIVAPSNASKWQMGFSSAFKRLMYK
jgi:hypothetical protein